MRRKNFKVREGFTLIELLIVLAIIGALMAIGIPIYTNALKSANATTIASNIRTIVDGVRTSLSLDGTAVEDASDYIQVEDATTNYNVDIVPASDHWTVTVTYRGSAAPADKVVEKLSGCATKNTDNNGDPYCAIDVPKTF